MPTTVCPGALFGCFLPRAEFDFWFHSESNPEWEDSHRQEAKQHRLSLSALLLLSLSTTEGSIDMQQEKYRWNAIQWSVKKKIIGSFQARLSHQQCKESISASIPTERMLASEACSGCWKPLLEWKLEHTYSWTCRASCFTRFRLGKTILGHQDAEVWEIYNHHFFCCFLNYTGCSFQWILLWRLSEMSSLLPPAQENPFRLAQVEPKKKTLPTHGDWARAAELGPLLVRILAFSPLPFVLRKFVECTCFSDLRGVVKPTEVQEGQSPSLK